jgi:hypothetical protein
MFESCSFFSLNIPIRVQVPEPGNSAEEFDFSSVLDFQEDETISETEDTDGEAGTKGVG